MDRKRDSKRDPGRRKSSNEGAVMIDEPELFLHPPLASLGDVQVPMPPRSTTPARPRRTARGKRSRTRSGTAPARGGGDGDPAPGRQDEILLSVVAEEPGDPEAFARAVMEARVRLALAHVRHLMAAHKGGSHE